METKTCVSAIIFICIWTRWKNGTQRSTTFAKFYSHKTISTPTVCMWITEVLWLSGFDTATFTGHSISSAAS